MSWQDIILTGGSIVFIIALLPSVFSNNKPASSTSAMTGSILLVFAFVYGSLHLWFATVTTLITAALWFTLLVQKLRKR